MTFCKNGRPYLGFLSVFPPIIVPITVALLSYCVVMRPTHLWVRAMMLSGHFFVTFLTCSFYRLRVSYVNQLLSTANNDLPTSNRYRHYRQSNRHHDIICGMHTCDLKRRYHRHYLHHHHHHIHHHHHLIIIIIIIIIFIIMAVIIIDIMYCVRAPVGGSVICAGRNNIFVGGVVRGSTARRASTSTG